MPRRPPGCPPHLGHAVALPSASELRWQRFPLARMISRASSRIPAIVIVRLLQPPPQASGAWLCRRALRSYRAGGIRGVRAGRAFGSFLNCLKDGLHNGFAIEAHLQSKLSFLAHGPSRSVSVQLDSVPHFCCYAEAQGDSVARLDVLYSWTSATPLHRIARVHASVASWQPTSSRASCCAQAGSFWNAISRRILRSRSISPASAAGGGV